MKNVDMKVAVSVAVGVALFGAAMWAIRQLPANAITSPVKKVADIAATR